MPFLLRLLPSVLGFTPTFKTRTSCKFVQTVRRRCRCVYWCRAFCHPRSQEGVRCIRERCQPQQREVQSNAVDNRASISSCTQIFRLKFITHRLSLAPMNASSYAMWRKIRGIPHFHQLPAAWRLRDSFRGKRDIVVMFPSLRRILARVKTPSCHHLRRRRQH